MIRENIFASLARLEFDEAILRYEKQQPGLGSQFEAEVDRVIQQIQEAPERLRLVGPTVRKARVLKRFRGYSICFYVQPDHIGVVSVFHGARDPEELQRRLKQQT
jgi:plasmid stabilization system protein ParE